MSRRMASLALMAALYGSVGIEKRKGYTANFERVNMKGLSAEQMGTANSRKKSRRKRKQMRDKKIKGACQC